jgi:hypothetical protein
MGREWDAPVDDQPSPAEGQLVFAARTSRCALRCDTPAHVGTRRLKGVWLENWRRACRQTAYSTWRDAAPACPPPMTRTSKSWESAIIRSVKPRPVVAGDRPSDPNRFPIHSYTTATTGRGFTGERDTVGRFGRAVCCVVQCTASCYPNAIGQTRRNTIFPCTIPVPNGWFVRERPS